MTLGYTFNSETLAKANIAGARLYFSVLNPITWSKYPYFNPEISDRPDSSLTTGEDYGSYPLARTYTFGLNFSF
jgi:hypothetical protein